MRESFSIRKVVYILLSVFIGLFLISSIHPTIMMDEEFSMGIIRHSYINVIKIDSLDVHPPLYYLLLKLFVRILTFWTNSVIVKILIARLFSFIVFIFSLYFLINSMKLIKTKINKILQILFYLFIPSVLSYSTVIRMYSLAALFISAEFYFIIKFNTTNNDRNLIYLIIFASLAAYTHYFAALSAGLFLFIFFIIYLLKNDFYKSKCYLMGGFIFALSYIPIIPFVLTQFNYESRNSRNYSNLLHELYSSFTGVGYSAGLLRIGLITIIIILFAFMILWSFHHISYKFNYYLLILLINFFATMLFAIFSNIIKGTPFTSRYMHPIFSIISFFIVYIFIQFIYTYDNKLVKYLIIMMSLILLLVSSHYMYKNVVLFDKPSVQLVSNYHKWIMSKSRRQFYIKTVPKNPKINAINITQSAIYLKSINKKALVNSKISNISNVRTTLFGHNNRKLFKKLFGNVIFK